MTDAASPAASREPAPSRQHSNSAAAASSGLQTAAAPSTSHLTAGGGDASAQTEPEELRETAQRCRQLWEEDEWVELHPRWPLTNRLHARAQAAVAGRPKPQGMKRKRLHRSLTELTAEALAVRSQHGVEHCTAEVFAASLSR